MQEQLKRQHPPELCAKKCTSIIHEFKGVVLYLVVLPFLAGGSTQNRTQNSTLKPSTQGAAAPFQQHTGHVCAVLAEQGPFRQHHPRSCLVTPGEKIGHFGSWMFDSFHIRQSSPWKTSMCSGVSHLRVQCSHVASASPSAWCGIPFHTEASASASIAKQKDDSIAGIA